MCSSQFDHPHKDEQLSKYADQGQILSVDSAGIVRQLSNARDIKMRWLSAKRKKPHTSEFLLTDINRRKN